MKERKKKKKTTEKYVLRLKFKNGRQITKKKECSEQFINTLNFTGFLFIKRVTKHISLI